MANYASPSATSPFSYVVVNLTVGDVITKAARLAGALKFAGQGLNPSEQQEFLDILNSYVDGCKIENLLIMFFMRTVVTMINGQKDYSVGPGQDFDIERPPKIHSAGFLLQPGQSTESELPMACLVNYQQYQQFVAKNTGSSIPLGLYYQPTIPYGTATIWPVPNQSSQIAIYTQGVLQEFRSFDDDFITPQGYRDMLTYGLAVRIHEMPPYNRMPMAASVEQRAAFYKERVKNQQLTPILMGSDPAVLGRRYSPSYGFPKSWTPYDT